ncbi:PREDICTED: snurportin-1 [Habropoda laboriosa]|uniref:snurportin-1 n=1 Tax=Habropoda laboriosa TaxID=597456 RepID=UPI00083D4629|nr:PREDICTED: snurportin-1 [Habropoda laboriosa]
MQQVYTIMAAEVKDNSTAINEEEKNYPRAIFYKKPIRKGNYTLDVDNFTTPQETRRQRTLLLQKSCRDIEFNARRGILEEVFDSEEDEYEGDMEIEENEKKYYSSKKYKSYVNQLMMSEWMLEVPQDFLDKWIIVPCPQGKRTLVVACKGITKAYNKRGNRLGKFYSALPGGNPSEYKCSCTIIDCLWIKQQKTYFVLDILAWANQCLKNCNTEFRFFWLQSRLQEIEELQEKNTDKNTYPILPLPNIDCNTDINSALANVSHLHPLDGLLFYHRDGIYTKGRTTFVTWLKPFMLPEVLGLSVPSPLDEKPDGYIDFKYYILNSRAKKRKGETESQNNI